LPEPAGEPGGVRWVFLGSQGLRAGWSVTIFFLLAFLFMVPLSFLANLLSNRVLHSPKGGFTPLAAIVQESGALLAILAAGGLVAFIERRRLLDYNLTGPRRTRRFVEGLFAGFLALSVLVGEMVAGGWLHFGPVALSGTQIVTYAALWGVCFALVGLFEEGAFRCYLQFTLTRGINFWWALAVETGICIDLALRDKGNGVWGVYAVALLGLLPCLLLELRKAEGSGFWQAAWVTSTVFGFIHTGNNGENWIGIFAAAAIGFVFCVSIWVTGSAWWAIGCHAGWDWAETYFYGTADSGLQAQGHYLTTNPAGNVLWSGGADGPEGSLLVLGVIVLLLLALLAIYGRKRASTPVDAALEQQTA
jgi:membrane protease YdiL (CAAX protease family)